MHSHDVIQNNWIVLVISVCYVGDLQVRQLTVKCLVVQYQINAYHDSARSC